MIQCYLSAEVHVEIPLERKSSRGYITARGDIQVYDKNYVKKIIFRLYTKGKIIDYHYHFDRYGNELLTLIVAFGDSQNECLQFTGNLKTRGEFFLSGAGFEILTEPRNYTLIYNSGKTPRLLVDYQYFYNYINTRYAPGVNYYE